MSWAPLVMAFAVLAFGHPSTSQASPSAVPVAIDGRTSCNGSAGPVYSGLTGAVADRLEEMQGKYEDQDGFRAVVYDGANALVIVARESLSTWQTRLKDSGVPVFPSCVPSSLVDAAHDAVRTLDRRPEGFAMAGYDALLDAVVIRTSEDSKDVLATVEQIGPGATTSIPAGALRVEVRDPAIASPNGRYNDAPSYWGGARIYVDVGGGLAKACSTGFYINSATNGTVMVTAGHCSMRDSNLVALNGRSVSNGDWTRNVGTTEGNKWPNPDLAVIDGQAYGAVSYSENDSTGSDNIRNSWTAPATGVTYCHYGQVSKRKCFQLSSLNVTNCPSGWGGLCTTGLAFTSGPSGPGGTIVSGGDSGGGMFLEYADGTIGARGIVHGGGCDASECAALFQRVQTVMGAYNATLP